MSKGTLVQEASQSGDPRVYRNCEDAYSASPLEVYEQETVSDLERGGHRSPTGLIGSTRMLLFERLRLDSMLSPPGPASGCRGPLSLPPPWLCLAVRRVRRRADGALLKEGEAGARRCNREPERVSAPFARRQAGFPTRPLLGFENPETGECGHCGFGLQPPTYLPPMRMSSRTIPPAGQGWSFRLNSSLIATQSCDGGPTVPKAIGCW
jgi:hypothetical protein